MFGQYTPYTTATSNQAEDIIAVIHVQECIGVGYPLSHYYIILWH